MSANPSRVANPSLTANPRLEQWLRAEPDGRFTVSIGKVELGQGIRAAIARIAAEELGVAPDRITVLTADTGASPNEGITAGSTSLVQCGEAVRVVAADARRRLDAGLPLTGLVELDAVSRPVGERTLVGRPLPRPELAGLVSGALPFVHDLRFPGMLHARVVRAPRPGATLAALDADVPLPGGALLVRDGSFLAVAAEREEHAIAARELVLRLARWEGGATGPGPDIDAWLDAQPDEAFAVVEGVPQPGPVDVPEPPADVTTIEATYRRPYLLHGSIGPSAAAAVVTDAGVELWCSSQAVFSLRDGVARVLGVASERVRVSHHPGSGSYGHNGADDAALDAALVARAVPGRHVLLKWTREDEHLFEPRGPAAAVTIRASLDADGSIADWVTISRSQTHLGRAGFTNPDASALLAAWSLDPPFPRPEPVPMLHAGGGIHRNASPPYRTGRTTVVKRFVAAAEPRTSALRSLGTHANVFAIESAVDELAEAAGRDPLELRLAHLDDPRARAVLETAARVAGWPGETGTGRAIGLGYSRYKGFMAHAAVAVTLSVDDATAAVRLEHIVIAADAGSVVDPGGLVAQLEGGALQSASWALMEEVAFEDGVSASRDWESYPILRFAAVPAVETHLIDRPHEPMLGAGEATQGPATAAIANAVYRATGIRVRGLPLTPERLRAAAAEA